MKRTDIMHFSSHTSKLAIIKIAKVRILNSLSKSLIEKLEKLYRKKHSYLANEQHGHLLK